VERYTSSREADQVVPFLPVGRLKNNNP